MKHKIYIVTLVNISSRFRVKLTPGVLKYADQICINKASSLSYVDEISITDNGHPKEKYHFIDNKVAY